MDVYSEIVSRLKLLQKRLIDNQELNDLLNLNFSVNFQKNLDYIQKNYPELFNRFAKFQIKNKRVICFENGEANVLDLQNGTLLYQESPIQQTKQQFKAWLNGKNSFIKGFNSEQNDEFCQLHFFTQNNINDEINKFFKEHSLQSQFSEHEIFTELPSLVINGGGLGYPLLEICSQIEPKFIFYIEPDIEMFLCSIGVIDWGSILTYLKENNQYIFFIVGHDGNESYKIYRQQIELHYPFLQAYQLCFSHYNSKNTDQFIDQFKKSVTLGYNSNGMFDDCIFGINNIIENSKKYKFVKKSLSNKYQNLPVAIVANGPSLDNDLEYLKVHKNNFIIVACGTAITALDNCDIIPDYYVAVERLDNVYHSLQDIKNNNIFEITTNISVPVIHPLTTSKFKNNLLVDKHNESLTKYFKRIPNIVNKLDNLLSCKNTNPLVTNCAISIFLNLNFKHYYLFGVDNGTTSLIKSHSNHSCYYTRNEKYNSSESTQLFDQDKVAGNFGEMIFSNILFNNCRNHIEQEIITHPTAKIYNCSNGAFIQGTIPVHSHSLNINIDITKQKEEYKDYLITEGSKIIELDQKNINSVFDKEQFNKTTDEIIKIWKIKSNKLSRIDIIQKMTKTYDYLNSNALEIEHSLLAGSLGVFFSLIIKGMYTYKDQNLTIQLTNKCISHIMEFLELSKIIYKNAEKIIQGKHFAYEPQIVYDNWRKHRNKS